MLQLVAGANGQGYVYALATAFLAQSKLTLPPAKSAFCRLRQKISFHFFEALLNELLSYFEPKRWTWKGLRLYAMDGNELSLPCTTDVLNAGYRGRALRNGTETYYPRLYLVHVFDVLSGVTKGIYFGPHRNELLGARELVPRLEHNCLCLYDRFYMSRLLLELHRDAGNYFLARVKKNAFAEVSRFCKSTRKSQTVVVHGTKINLFKSKIPHCKQPTIIATNLPRHLIDKKSVYKLYALRWQVENSFRDLACTIKIQQWHSHNLNGLLQELYSAYWLMNYARIEIALHRRKPRKLIELEYEAPNFKLLFQWLVMWLVADQTASHFEYQFNWLLAHSTERRRRLSRQYPRAVRYAQKNYKRINTATKRGLK